MFDITRREFIASPEAAVCFWRPSRGVHARSSRRCRWIWARQRRAA